MKIEEMSIQINILNNALTYALNGTYHKCLAHLADGLSSLVLISCGLKVSGHRLYWARQHATGLC